jgi:hypothetical protein
MTALEPAQAGCRSEQGAGATAPRWAADYPTIAYALAPSRRGEPMRTILNLLTRDGVVYMAFSPPLNPEQYAELWELTHHPETNHEMEDAVQGWAQRQRLKVSFNESDREE